MSEPGPARSLSDSRRAKKDVAKYLLEDETAVIATRRHWASLVLPAVRSLPILVIGGWLFLLDPRNHVTSAVGLLVLVGGLAAVVQGAPIATLDVDIVHRRTPENVDRLIAFLASTGARYRNRPDPPQIGRAHV